MNSTVFNRKNKFLIIILVILIIPALLAIYFAATATNKASIKDTATSIVVTSPGYVQTVLSLDHEISAYDQAVKYATPITADYLEGTSPGECYTVTVSNKDGSASTYKFYMKYNNAECYFINPKGEYYLIDSKNAATLLERREFEGLNIDRNIPAFNVGINDVILMPTSGEWHYLKTDGSYETVFPETANNPLVKINALSLSPDGKEWASFYNVQPDSLVAVLSKDGNVIHEGDYKNILSNNVLSNSDTYYDLVLTATWNKNNDTDAPYGTVSYSAKLLYDVSPTYSIQSGAVYHGDFGILQIKNFNDGDTLYAKCEYESIPETLEVFSNDALGYKFAFLPSEYNANSQIGKTYSLQLSTNPDFTDAQTVSFKLSNTSQKPAKATQEITLLGDVSLTGLLTAETVEEFNKIVANVNSVASTADKALWSEKFIYPNGSTSAKAKLGTGMADYGTIIKASDVTYMHGGVDIAMEASADVVASNAGKVVYAGTSELMGNMIIIDHGCSLLSYYGHLETMNVSVGENVTKAQKIGSVGSTGFAVSVNEGGTAMPAHQVHFAISVSGKFVVPYFFVQSGVVFNPFPQNN